MTPMPTKPDAPETRIRWCGIHNCTAHDCILVGTDCHPWHTDLIARGSEARAIVEWLREAAKVTAAHHAIADAIERRFLG